VSTPRPRDSAKTRQMLLEAARRRFAMNGYSATTVRHIADDAGVNVALIGRYFGSKEGLFEACLEGAVADLKSSTAGVNGIADVVETISQVAVGASEEGWPGEVLLLLLRSSGDPAVEEKRIGMLQAFGTAIASTAGWIPEPHAADDFLLRAQLVLSMAVGVVILRASSPGLEPLGLATAEQLFGPLLQMVDAMLGPKGEAPRAGEESEPG
jgi:AcrR family transcriptional regulator